MRFTRSLLLVASLAILPNHMPAQSGAHKTPADQFEFHMKTTGFEAFNELSPRHRSLLTRFGALEDPWYDQLVGCSLVSQQGAIWNYECCDPNGENCALKKWHAEYQPVDSGGACYFNWIGTLYSDGTLIWEQDALSLSCY
jgi:hypothetical protein